jgi:hypothetical protein
MESSRGRRVEKRGYEQGVDDEADNLPESKKAKVPALARFVFALLHEVYCLQFLLQVVHGLSNLCCGFVSWLEGLIRTTIRELKE